MTTEELTHHDIDYFIVMVTCIVCGFEIEMECWNEDEAILVRQTETCCESCWQEN